MSAVNIYRLIAFATNLLLVALVLCAAHEDGSDKAIILILFYLPIFILLNVIIWLLLRKLKPTHAGIYKETSVMLVILFIIFIFADDLF